MIRAATAVLLAAACAALGGCERDVGDPRDQWVVAIGTDAPVPQLGDRVLVELLRADGTPACDNCRREFGVSPPSDAEDAPPPTFPLSFGIVPEGDVDRVRVRLYRTDSVGDDGLPRADHIDAVARLPEAVGIVKLALPLRMSCFGVTGDASAQTTCDPSTGALVDAPEMSAASDVTLPKTGSWPPAETVPCAGAADPDMICIEGGAFLVGGDDALDGVRGTTSLPERLLRVAPFAIDREEMTVAAMRATGAATPIDPVRRLPDVDENRKKQLGLCTYSDTASPELDGLPVDCVSHEVAQAACAALGKRLPNEEEWELAAGSRTLELAFPWGDDDTQICSRAVLAKGRLSIEQELAPDTVFEEYECRGEQGPGAVAGGNPLDVTAEGVLNMAGNVDEWVADAYAPYTDPCWTVAPGTARSGPCLPPAPVAAASYAVRGGSYVDAPVNARVTNRKKSTRGAPAPGRGFRCAKSL